MSFELVIFDCDGVLVDSEPKSNRVLARVLTEVGLPTRYEDAVATYKGRSWQACLALVEERLGGPPPAHLTELFRSRVLDEFRAGLEPVAHVSAALDEIRAPVCVASSSDPERLRTCLEMTGLRTRFDGRIFSATEVERGKPAPDLFLHAARALGARPQRCAVIEDSPLGVEAALAADMTPLGFAGTSTADAAALAAAGARVFDDMRELPRLLQQRLQLGARSRL